MLCVCLSTFCFVRHTQGREIGRSNKHGSTGEFNIKILLHCSVKSPCSGPNQGQSGWHAECSGGQLVLLAMEYCT